MLLEIPTFSYARKLISELLPKFSSEKRLLATLCSAIYRTFSRKTLLISTSAILLHRLKCRT
jgi:hypothetical protein